MIVLTGSTSRPKMSPWFDTRTDLGMMLSPSSWRRPWCALYACDNDAFSNCEDPDWFEREGRDAWLRMLDKIPADHPPLFVLLPDVVGNWSATIYRAWQFRDEVLDRGLPVALALQDGASLDAATMFGAHWWFIGGSTRWKWANAERIVRFAHATFGTRVHVGRAGGVNRVRECLRIGADSCDGSQWQTYERVWMPRLVDVLDGTEPQLHLPLTGHGGIHAA